ncbi:hypothetical protein EV421DRAFT_1213347 [Armillaria borealis]|uniref:DUF6535 domain-containing protein n=1 Tax=Armillaria borealis TaxID=47425 RepID=A0AA39MYU7_9AGAR|nr:hypothetical protein EV421DRAFT_1213347 [Armillaria borealis]
MLTMPSRARGLDCEDLHLTDLPKATILSTTKKSIQKMRIVKRWDPTLGSFVPTLMSVQYMTRVWSKRREMVLTCFSFSRVYSRPVVTTFVALNVSEFASGLHRDICQPTLRNDQYPARYCKRCLLGHRRCFPLLIPNTMFIASTTSIWVNGLWFTSLALSLTTALVSVLVKQWLHHYMALPSGTPRERSLLRQF